MNDYNYDDIDYSKFDTFEQNDFRATMSEAVKVNPDQRSENVKLSKESGVPLFAVENNPAEVKEKYDYSNIDYSKFQQKNPKTSIFLSNYDNATVAHDDLDVMGSIENTLTNIKDYGSEIKKAYKRGQLNVESAYVGFDRMNAARRGESIQDPRMADIENRMKEFEGDKKDWGFFSGAPITVSEMMPILFDIAPKAIRGFIEGAPAGAVLGTTVWPGIGSVAGFFGGGSAGAGGRSLEAAYNLEAGLAFNELMDLKDPVTQKTLDPKIAAYAATTVGAINAALETFSLGAIGKTASPLVKMAVKNKIAQALATETGRAMITRLAGKYGVAVATEGITEGLQELTNVAAVELAKYADKEAFTEQDMGSVVDNILSEENINRIAEAGKGGAQAGMVLGFPGTAANIYMEHQVKKSMVNDEVEKLDRLNADSEISNLRRRDKETFKQFVEQADGDNNTTVFVDAAQARLYLNTKTVKEIQDSPALTILNDKVDEAAATGGEIQIPIAEFSAEIAGTEHYGALRDSITLSENSVPMFRQEQNDNDFSIMVQRVMADAQLNIEEEQQAQTVFDTVKQQLIDSGRVKPENATTMGEVVKAWAVARARRTGQTIEQTFADTGLKIEGPQTGEAARIAEGMKKFEQSAYHGTPFDFDRFSTDAMGTGEGAQVYGWGLYFAENKEIAEFYRKNLTAYKPNQLGQLYEVELPENDELLIWDVPLSEQSDHVKSKIKKLWSKIYDEPISRISSFSGESFYKDLSDMYGSDEAASNVLNRNGIKGHKFLDATSRKSNDEKSYNFVIYDDTSIEILKKYYQPTSPDRPGARGYYSPKNSLIRLTEASNLSTFQHEFAHFMLDTEMKADSDFIKPVMDWYNETHDTFDDVEFHEQFARGFEAYLMEGKAPSVELRNIFATISRWMTQIYKKIRNLNVNLTDDMRAFFDRMLATEEQIQAAELRAKYEPMFTDATMAGLTDKQFEEYKKRQEKVKNAQSETLRDKMVKQLQRQSEKWWKEEKQDIIGEEIKNLETERVFIARNRLSAPGEIKLNFVTTKEMIGETKTDKLGRKSTRLPRGISKMTVRNDQGVHPDQAAILFGYGSGHEMLKDLANTPDIKEVAGQRAEAEMIKRHGDIFSDGTIERAADEAIQNEERGKLLLKELEILGKGTTTPKIDRLSIKNIAKEKISQLSFHEIFPGKYRKAEIRAAQDAARELASGNKGAAADAKLRQIMNYYLGMEAAEAKANIVKIVDHKARYNKTRFRENIMRGGQDYMDQIDKILHRFEFRKSATLAEVENLNTWAANKILNEGDNLVLSNAVLNETVMTHWKNVPYNDLQGIDDSVKNIEHVARYNDKIRLGDQQLEYKKLKDQIVKHLGDQAQKFTPKSKKKISADVEQNGLGDVGRKWVSQLTKIPFLATWLDGGERIGLMHDVLMEGVNNALDYKYRLYNEVASPVIDLIKNRSKDDIARHNRKYKIDEINDTLYGHQIIAVALNTGNKGNLKKMLLGEGWARKGFDDEISINNPKLQAVLTYMTSSDWAMVQSIWDQMDKLYPLLEQVHRESSGLTAPKVEAVPVETKYGTFNGGYYPVKYSHERSHKAQKNLDKLNASTESLFDGNGGIGGSVNAGATNERTGFYDKINLSLDVVSNHFGETIHYITHHAAVKQLNRLINDPDIADSIISVVGEEEYKQLMPWLNDIAKDGRVALNKSFIEKMFGHLRMGVTLGVMGFKASTGIMQTMGLYTTAAEVGLPATIKAIYTTVGRSWYMKAIRKSLGSTETMQSTWDFAVEKSKVMAHRMETMDREIRHAMTQLKGEKGIMAAVKEASMKHIAYIQTYTVDLPTWMAGYDKMLSETGDKVKAAKYADWCVENLQGSGATKDMSVLLRTQTNTHATFTMFMTYFSSLGNLTRDMTRGARSGQYSVTDNAAKIMFLFTLPVITEMLMRGEFDEPAGDDDRMQKTLLNLALYPVQSVPFVRDVAAGLFGEFGYKSSPVASILEKGISGTKLVAEGLFTDKEISTYAIKNVIKLGGAAAQIPGINQVWASGEHLYNVIENGEELTLNELIYGQRRNK